MNYSERARLAAGVFITGTVLVACVDRTPTGFEALDPSAAGSVTAASATVPSRRAMSAEVRRLAAARGITPMPPPPGVRGSLAQLGRLLAFDKELSGNRDVSCMTCHMASLATGDGRSLAIGQGGTGLGPARTHPEAAFIPRNAPPLFNLHLLDHLFWDGRVSIDAAGRLHLPAETDVPPELETVLEYGAVSAIGLFPVLSRSEMRGEVGDNELADMEGDPPAVWAALMKRLGAIPAYRRLFESAYPGTPFDDMNFAHAANAIAGFLLDAFVFGNSPWDRFLGGSDVALTEEQLEGARLFMTLPCSSCHNGPGFSDDAFHNVALAQFGPGMGDGPSRRDDFGRERVTGAAADRYRFRTTMLRNVELTGPWGHAGQFADLARFIDHYSDNAEKLRAYGEADVTDPLLRGMLLRDNIDAIIAQRDALIVPASFDQHVVAALTAFMSALTDERARRLERITPHAVPSGLPVDR